MRDYKITLKLDSIINFDEPFSMNDMLFFYENGVLYAQTSISASGPMEAQGLAFEKASSVCSVISYIFQYPVYYYIEKVEELNEEGNIISSMSSKEASLYVRKILSKSNMDEIIKITKLMKKNEELEKVMRLVNRPDFKTWVILYKVYEIIDHNADVKKQKWIPEKKRNLFKRTANHPEASGLEARHGFQKEEPPENPMGIEEAVSLINNLIEQWINFLTER